MYHILSDLRRLPGGGSLQKIACKNASNRLLGISGLGEVEAERC